MINAINITGRQNGYKINRECCIQITELKYLIIYRRTIRFIRMMVDMNGWSCIIGNRGSFVFQQAFAITGFSVSSKIIGYPAINIADMLLVLSNKENNE